MKGARLGDTGYCLREEENLNFPKSPHSAFSESLPLAGKHPFPTLLPSTPMFPDPGPVCSVWEPPSPPSFFLQPEEKELVSVTCLWLQKKTLDSGVLPISLEPYLSHYLSHFFFSPTEPLALSLAVPCLLLFSRLIAKARPFVGDHKPATPLIYWLVVRGG